MANNNTGKSEFVNPTCLDGLKILKEHNLVFLATPTYDIFADHSSGNGELVVSDSANNNEESKETYSSIELKTSWSDKVRFDDNGFVVSLDLGGRRLHKGLPFEPAIFGSFPHLTTLSLAGTDLPLGDILVILPHIESTIECLYLGGNGLGVKGGKAIAASVLFQPETPSKLVKLDLRYNDIGSAGMEEISAALKNNTETNVLQYLYLEGNNIGDEGCAALSDFLSSQPASAEDNDDGENSSCCTIQEIYLGANKISPLGAESIASVLRVNKTISKIYLEGNALGAQGAAAFCNVLEELQGDTGLKHLYVDNNNIGKELSNRLAKALRSDTVIEDIH